MKKGLILEGGAMRGLFTAGVLDVLMENSVSFDGAIGVSAGAAFGCNFKSEQIGRAIRYNKRFCKDKRYCGLHSLLKTGNIYNAEFCYREIPLKHDAFDFDTYEKNPMEFYVVCTDIETGKAVYHLYSGREDHEFDWFRASASMPLVSQIVEIGSLRLLDGGIADSIPVRYFSSIGYDRNVVILTQPGTYQKKPNPFLPLIKVKYRHYPKLVQAMENRHLMYNQTLAYISQREKEGSLYVIRPEQALPIGKVEKDPQKMQRVYELGRSAAQEHLQGLQAYLSG